MAKIDVHRNRGSGLRIREVDVGNTLLASLSTLALITLAASVHAEPGPAQPPGSTAGGNAVVPEPVPLAKSRKSRTIFACRSGVLVEFSDRPCDLAATSRSLGFTTGASAGSAPSTRPREAVASTRPKVAAPPTVAATDERDDAAQKARCASLQGQLDAVDSRMREGYAARDAARLWNRWRELKGQLHASDC